MKNSSTLSSFGFTRDDVGNPAQIVTQTGAERYTYDVDNRLTEACYQAAPATAREIRSSGTPTTPPATA